MEIKTYGIETDKLKKEKPPLRIVLLADLHNRLWGEGQEKLLSAIDRLKGDVVLCAGDMLLGNTRARAEHTLALFEGMARRKLTVIAANGNHESRMRQQTERYGRQYDPQTVETMLKCIAVASANDACVAMAEHISGSEGDFVKRMNERAAELGMKNTHFVNCCGLDDDGHLTTARDVAIMSRELLLNHPRIHDYCTIWMENIVHTTARGSFEFGLSNTNKLIRQYEYATGLKTGYTSVAGFCVSASAKKDDIELVAVVMGGADSKSRFQDAITLLNSGFACCSIYKDEEREALSALTVTGGVEQTVPLKYAGEFSYVSTDGSNLSDVRRSIELPQTLEAPVEQGRVVGRAVYTLNGREIGFTQILADASVEQAGYRDYVRRTVLAFLL